MKSLRVALVFVCVLTAGCHARPHDYPEPPSQVSLEASVVGSAPANVTVVDWNETSLSANETVRAVVQTAAETNASGTTISVATYKSLRDQFYELPNQTIHSETVTEPDVYVYVRYHGDIIQIHLNPLIAM